MFEVLNPLWLLGLAAVPAIYALHRHLEAGAPLRVSALFLWPRTDAAPRGARQQRRRNPAWRRRALAAALMTLAAAGPRLNLTPAPHPLVWFDTGPSMAVVEPTGTRHELGVDALVAALTETGAGGAEIRDLWHGRPPLTLAPGSPAAWRQALRRWLDVPAATRPEPGTAPLPGPLDGLQWLVTDGAADTVTEWAGDMPVARIIGVGTATVNAGIENLAVRAAAGGGASLEGLARLRNASPEPVKRTLRLTWPGGATTLPALALDPGGRRLVTFRLPAAAVGETLVAELLPADPLANDDRLELNLTSIPIRLQAGCPEPLARLVGTLPGLAPAAGGTGITLTCSDPQPAGQGPRLHVAAPDESRTVDGPLSWSAAAAGLRELVLDPAAVAVGATPAVGTDWLLAAGAQPLIAESGPPDRRRIDARLDLARLHAADPEGLALLLAGLLERLAAPGTVRGLWQHLAPDGVVAIAPRTIIPGGSSAPAAVAGRSLDLGRALAAAALAVLLLDAVRAGTRPAALIPRLGLAVALALAVWLPTGARTAGGDLILLLDDSASVGREALNAAWRVVREDLAAAAGNLRLGVLRFAGGVVEELNPGAEGAAMLAGDRPPRSRALDRDATDLEVALRQAARWRRPGRNTAILVVSDGRENAGNALPVIRALHSSGLPLWVLGPAGGTRPAPPGLRDLHVPARLPAAAPVPVTALLDAASGPVTLEVDGVPAPGPAVSAGPGGTRVARSWLHGPGAGFVRVTARADADMATAVINLPGPAHIGYVTAAPDESPLRAVLARRDYAVTDALPAELATLLATPDLAAVVLEDVAVDDADPAAWQALAQAVRSRGLGLLVLGGPRSFAAGGYRGSRLESLLPVISEPPPGRPPVAVQFLVDSSGSMGQGAGGGDPIAAAREAVITTARGLAAGDRVGLMAFDVVGREVLSLTPQAEAVAALAGGWAPATGGGTRLSEAFDDAVAALAGTAANQRLLVLISDGRLTDAPTAASLERLRQAAGRLVVVAVGGDPDGRLAMLATAAAAPLLRVAETARLPRVAAAAVEGLLLPPRAGPLVPVVRGSAPYLGARDALPTWSAAPVTRPQAAAAVPVADPGGLPLVAEWQAGLGRVMAVPAGFAGWAGEWLAWPHWPAVAAAMVERCAGGRADHGLDVRTRHGRDGLVLEAEALAADGGWSTAPLTLRTRGPDGVDHEAELMAEAPGRYRAILETPVPGVYGLRVGIEDRSLVHHFAVGSGNGGERAGGGRDVLAEAAAQGLSQPWSGLNGFLAAPAAGMSRTALLALALAAWMVLLAVETRPRTVSGRNAP